MVGLIPTLDYMDQVIQMAGALVVLGAFVANQRRLMTTDSVPFLAMNAVGTGILAVIAGMNGDAGFLLLEGVWSIISLVGLMAALRRPAQTAAAGTSAVLAVEKAGVEKA